MSMQQVGPAGATIDPTLVGGSSSDLANLRDGAIGGSHFKSGKALRNNESYLTKLQNSGSKGPGGALMPRVGGSLAPTGATSRNLLSDMVTGRDTN